MLDSKLRSLVKAITWRIIGTLDTFVISWWITDHLLIASGIAFTELTTKTLLYVLHEQGWNKIEWGRN
jgi:uncharacterized membrane protein